MVLSRFTFILKAKGIILFSVTNRMNGGPCLKIKFLLTVFLLLFSFAALYGDETDIPPDFDAFLEEEFDKADENGDGVLNDNEIRAEILNDFNTQDLDFNTTIPRLHNSLIMLHENLDSHFGDGEITHEDHVGDEYFGKPATNDQRAELIHDSDDNGIVSLEEFSNSVNLNVVDVIDLNNNGEITLEEVKNFHTHK